MVGNPNNNPTPSPARFFPLRLFCKTCSFLPTHPSNCFIDFGQAVPSHSYSFFFKLSCCLNCSKTSQMRPANIGFYSILLDRNEEFTRQFSAMVRRFQNTIRRSCFPTRRTEPADREPWSCSQHSLAVSL